MDKIKTQKGKAKGLAVIIGVLLLNACAPHKIPPIIPLQVKETSSPYSGRNYVICKKCLKYTSLNEVVVIHKMTQQRPVKQQKALKAKRKISKSKAGKPSKIINISKPCVVTSSTEEKVEATTQENLKASTSSNLPLKPIVAKAAEEGTTVLVEKQELTQTK